MYDKVSVTPGEYFSFIEFCDKGHSANEHIKKYAWKSLDIEKFDYDLICKCWRYRSCSKPFQEVVRNFATRIKICKHSYRTSRQSYDNLRNNQWISFGGHTYSQ